METALASSSLEVNPSRELIPDIPPIMELRPLSDACEAGGGVTTAVAAYMGLITHMTATNTASVGNRTMAENSLKCFRSLLIAFRRISIKPMEDCLSIKRYLL